MLSFRFTKWKGIQITTWKGVRSFTDSKIKLFWFSKKHTSRISKDSSLKRQILANYEETKGRLREMYLRKFETNGQVKGIWKGQIRCRWWNILRLDFWYWNLWVIWRAWKKVW